MDITFKCDLCGQEIVIDEAGAGSVVECPKCRARVLVPNKSTPPTGPSPSESKQCPFCAETIKAQAIVCRYCGRDLRTIEQQTQHNVVQPSPEMEYKPDWMTRGITAAQRTAHARAAYEAAGLGEVSEGNIAAAYFLAVIVPFIGFFAGIYLLAKKQPGHGVACMAISVVAFFFWIALLRSC